jgi:hypothetical protein
MWVGWSLLVAAVFSWSLSICVPDARCYILNTSVSHTSVSGSSCIHTTPTSFCVSATCTLTFYV